MVNGDLAGAIASYREALEYAPDNPDLWSSLGGLYAISGEAQQASRAYERSLEIKPSYEALNNLGSLKFEQGAYEQAAALFRHASEIDPGDFRTWGNLGDALTASGSTAAQTRAQYEQAATLGRRYLELKSDDAQSLALVAWYAANLDRAGEARALLGKAESLGTERGEVALLGAQTMARLGDPAAARRHIDFARKHGIPQQRIEALPLLRSLTATVEPSSEREPGAAR
jgi:tetratricopeptide (TPR) repeat protein